MTIYYLLTTTHSFVQYDILSCYNALISRYNSLVSSYYDLLSLMYDILSRTILSRGILSRTVRHIIMYVLVGHIISYEGHTVLSRYND